ncbi:Reticulocalbin-3 [Tupaia chinensis]|uniref:Reticulocalbin-3 n=1 Tax=Tupaia chinensis TaxID=246437 RepID=L9JDU1_TUPCH|nr:Reticulocalbin-3 [Tupaia chinensis]
MGTATWAGRASPRGLEFDLGDSPRGAETVTGKKAPCGDCRGLSPGRASPRGGAREPVAWPGRRGLSGDTKGLDLRGEAPRGGRSTGKGRQRSCSPWSWGSADTAGKRTAGWGPPGGEEPADARTSAGSRGPGEEFHDVEDAETYKKMLARDERRFRVADQDGDSMATREELTAFLHPEEFPHMRDIVIAETLEDLDKNGDGYVQVEEYIADLYSEEPGAEEPAWVQTERQQFRDFRDLNKDGRLDGSEVGHWVLPPSQDQPLVEANHLLQESDTDKDGRLSKAEILGNWNMFVGSQATNYGEDLTRHHDEL